MFNLKVKKLVGIAVGCSISSVIAIASLQNSDAVRQHYTLNMENTINPLIRSVVMEACNPNTSEAQLNAALIYKREARSSCISSMANKLYARCYISEWQEKALFFTPIRDVRLNEAAYSCIDEEEVSIPYYDGKLANSLLGTRYLVVDHSK